jgi:hypothetical protein
VDQASLVAAVVDRIERVRAAGGFRVGPIDDLGDVIGAGDEPLVGFVGRAKSAVIWDRSALISDRSARPPKIDAISGRFCYPQRVARINRAGVHDLKAIQLSSASTGAKLAWASVRECP